ncbi:serine/threonine protein kinase [Polytolypa hystricis UAMH7299]|uniref:Serine/threonine protein kinase n=1 Tax=Polytolypa hystricis (strain UAMH7299) TaxID=1447883 RepID=A0A2B7WXV6_POLH7|nr:serine/threonine protein kinase [Polytolypa hystricis UAMH7299]
MSSRAPGHILLGAHWNYHILEAVKGDNTHASTVFKAKVVPHENTINAPQWFVGYYQSRFAGDATAQENLTRECQSYLLPGVASAACFRQLYDVVNDSTIALEWLDTTLAEVKYQPDMRTYTLIKTFLRAALTSCVVLERKNIPDYKPANILISGIETDRVTAKVGDFGLVFPSGDRLKAQPYSMRAPEVFLGQACTELSQVWAVSAMLFCWIMPCVLGAWDSPHFFVNDAWSMAKIKRLFPGWKIPTPDEIEGHVLKVAVRAARRMSEDERDVQAILPFEEETQKVEMPQQLRDLLRLMLVVNPDKRPSASSVLASTEFRAFEKLVSIGSSAQSSKMSSLGLPLSERVWLEVVLRGQVPKKVEK